MSTKKVNILGKKPEKRKAVSKNSTNKRAKVDDDDVILLEEPPSTVVIDDDDDDGYAPLALPLLPSKAQKSPIKTPSIKPVPKNVVKKKFVVVPVSSNTKITPSNVMSNNVVKRALSSLSNIKKPDIKAIKPSEVTKLVNKITPVIDNSIKVKLNAPEASNETPHLEQNATPSAPTGDHDYFSANAQPPKRPPIPTLNSTKTPLKNNSSALNASSNSAPKPIINSKVATKVNDLLNNYPVPENLKIDLNSNKITIGNEICTVNSFQYCGNQRMKVFVAATDKSPARTIVLRKMPEQNAKEMKNVATVFNPPKSPAKPSLQSPPLAKPSPQLPSRSVLPTRPVLTPATPGPTQSKTPVYVIKPNQQEKKQKAREDARATRKLLEEISKAIDLEDKKSNKSCSSESDVQDAPKEKHGRRWTELNKLHSLAMHQSSQKRYRLLNSIFAMPTNRSIISSFRRIKIATGINSQLLYLYYYMNKTLIKEEEPCAVMFEIVTFTLKNKVPEYCLIFYLKTLTTGIEQVAGFWVQLHTFSADKITSCIKEMICACHNVGINVACLVGDSKYLRVFNQLGVSEKDPFFVINLRKVFAIFEPKNLLVTTRNTFFKHDIHIEGQKGEKLLATWRHLKDCITFDRVNTYQQMPKIDDSVLDTEKHDKAKFSNARKVLSYKMGSCINGYICSGYVDKSALGSATYIVKLNRIFNSFFGKSETNGVNSVIHKSKENAHLELWSSSYEEIKKWKYIDNIKSFTPQCQKCLLLNLKSLPLLWLKLKGDGVVTFNLNKLTTRPIEKFVTRLKTKMPKGKNVSIVPTLTKAAHTAIDSTISQIVSIVNKNKSKDEILNDFMDQITSSETYDQFIQDIDVRVKHEISSDESDDEK